MDCKRCETTMLETEYGSQVCSTCGVEDFASILYSNVSTHAYCVPICSPATYTRLKRFKKYLNRSTMTQSQNSIPAATWDYLLRGAPFKSPGHIVHWLKKAPSSVRKKCYDSLPLLVHHLCPNLTVPRLCEREKAHAVRSFLKLDAAYNQGEQFVSYLYALEYILHMIGRADMLPFINKISCRKRRYQYKRRLDRIFNNTTQGLVGNPAAQDAYSPDTVSDCRSVLGVLCTAAARERTQQRGGSTYRPFLGVAVE